MTRKERLDTETKQIQHEAKEMREALKPLEEIRELEKWQHKTFGYMNQECARGFKEHCVRLETQLAAANAKLENCAAGPWSTDVESAPKDGTFLLLLCKIHPANEGHEVKIGRFETQREIWTDGVWQLYVTAWAPIHAHPAALQTKKLNEME